MEKVRLDNEDSKKITIEELAKLEEAMKLRDREMDKLDYAVECKKKSGQTQDEEVGWLTWAGARQNQQKDLCALCKTQISQGFCPVGQSLHCVLNGLGPKPSGRQRRLKSD